MGERQRIPEASKGIHATVLRCTLMLHCASGRGNGAFAAMVHNRRTLYMICRWPGQVADPDKAAERHLAIRKHNTLLIYFFGDRSFGWFQPDTLAPFEELFDQLSTVKTKQAVR